MHFLNLNLDRVSIALADHPQAARTTLQVEVRAGAGAACIRRSVPHAVSAAELADALEAIAADIRRAAP